MISTCNSLTPSTLLLLTFLRRAWGQCLGDVQDDPEWIRARLRILTASLRTVAGDSIHTRLESELDEEMTNKILGRSLPLDEWVLSKIDRLDPFPEVDDEQARLLERALSRSQWNGASDDD